MIHLIGDFCTAYGLGPLLAEPASVSGGLMHTMYRVKTAQGEYAVKILNADIMKRPTAYQNMVNSEIISNALKDVVPLVAARAFGGKHVIEFKGAFWMVFDWLEGHSIFPPDLTAQHCARVGDLLGRIHAADLRVDTMACDTGIRQPFAWRELLNAAQQENPKCFALLQEHWDAINAWDDQLVVSWPLVQRHQVISHRDLDPKNILWQDGQPFIIDWEAAGYVNPAQELVEVLNYWMIEPDGHYSREKFDAMQSAYAAHMDLSGTDWKAVLSAGYAGMLGWLEYNAKRAAGLEGSAETDRAEGIAQVQQTLQELYRYQQQMDQLGSWMTNNEKTVRTVKHTVRTV